MILYNLQDAIYNKLAADGALSALVVGIYARAPDPQVPENPAAFCGVRLAHESLNLDAKPFRCVEHALRIPNRYLPGLPDTQKCKRALLRRATSVHRPVKHNRVSSKVTRVGVGHIDNTPGRRVSRCASREIRHSCYHHVVGIFACLHTQIGNDIVCEQATKLPLPVRIDHPTLQLAGQEIQQE